MSKKEDCYYWPLWFSKILNPSEQAKIKNILPKLQNAQIFLWRALNIYDDFFDGEGVRSELPRANNYLRRYLAIHYHLNLPPDYYRLLEKLFNNLDRANSQEILEKKLKIKKGRVILPSQLPKPKNLKFLARKSLVLALGPLALLAYLGEKMSSKRGRATLNFFICVLSAKQLADDSHDWLEDLRAGFITNANLPILLAAKRKKLKLNLDGDLTAANLLFAYDAAPRIIADLENLCAQARREVEKLNNNPRSSILNNLIRPLEIACTKAKKFRALIN